MSSIPQSDFATEIPDRLRPFLLVAVADGIDEQYRPVVAEFGAACRLIADHARCDRRAQAIFTLGFIESALPGGSGIWSFRPAKHIINVVVQDIIFINCPKMFHHAKTPALRTATILEELVHFYMSVTDEDLVSRIVCWLLPSVEWTGSVYREVAASTPGTHTPTIV